MSPPAKRQKVSVSTRRSQGFSGNGTNGIEAFTRVSKASSTARDLLDKDCDIQAITRSYSLKAAVGSKRKTSGFPDQENTKTPTDHRSIKQTCHETLLAHAVVLKTPRKHFSNRRSICSRRNPSTSAASLLDISAVASKPGTTSPVTSTTTSYRTTRPFFVQDRSRSQALPDELLDLINLHAAILTAISLHYTHHGSASPADLRFLCPNVARTWGKRRVIIDDIRRSLGVMNSVVLNVAKHKDLPRLSLSDYGGGKVCVEIRVRIVDNVIQPLKEDRMNDIFIQSLQEAWSNRDMTDTEAKTFVATLPMEPVTTCSSLAKISPLLAKGQRRLEDMKTIFRSEQSSSEEQQIATNAHSARPTLLERLRAKQIHQSALPPPPTRAELDRKAALQRLGEVIAIISVLSTSSSVGQSRVSYTMPTILAKLKDSSSRALSKDEGELCIRLLASEIAPDWIRMVKMGKIEAVVVVRGQKPVDLDIQTKLRLAATGRSLDS